MMDIVAMRQVFIQVLQFPLPITILLMLYTHISEDGTVGTSENAAINDPASLHSYD
jgi:hypothetical protein